MLFFKFKNEYYIMIILCKLKKYKDICCFCLFNYFGFMLGIIIYNKYNLLLNNKK